MTTERAQEFQMRITEEALALMIIHGESVSDAPSEEDISLAHYEEAVTLIGKAWGLPAEATAENLGLIQREKDVLRRIAAGENVNHILPEEELPVEELLWEEPELPEEELEELAAPAMVSSSVLLVTVLSL